MQVGSRTAREAGWHLSRYNISSRLRETGETVVVNLFSQRMLKCSAAEAFLLEAAEELNEDHPILPRFKMNGFLVNFDEKAALDSMGRAHCARSDNVCLTICTTLRCNFDCTYCFEKKREGRMTAETQDRVVSFTEKMLEAFSPKSLSVIWFGGEPLLAPEVIESLSERLIRLAADRGIRYFARIITNGYLLTEKNIALLERCRVTSAQISVDGPAPVHDAARHLAGGGGTYDRILSNLTSHPIPFRVVVRQNIHRDNLHTAGDLERVILKAAERSGNRLEWFPDLAVPSPAAKERGADITFLDRSALYEADVYKAAHHQTTGTCYCFSQQLCSAVIDEEGRLFKCWEDVDDPEKSFGTVESWDPRRPMENLDRPDRLTCYLNTACPIPDPECADCVWLPLCRGGCPHQRLAENRACVAFRNDPDAFVRMFYAKKSGRPAPPEG